MSIIEVVPLEQDAGARVAGAQDAGAADPRAALSWTTVCTLDQLEPLWGDAALIDDVQIAVFLLPDGQVRAVSNQDPATGSFVMSRGIVGSRAGRPTIASPLHKQVYDLESGECYTNGDFALATFPVDVVDGDVRVGLATGPA